MVIKSYVFLHQDKINMYYSQTCSRVEEQIKKTKGTVTKGGVTGSLKFGELLKSLFVNPEISGELSHENANSQEVVEKLEPVQKLNIVLASLQKDNFLIDFNSNAQIDLKNIIDSFITAKLMCKVTPPYKKKDNILFGIEGSIGDLKLHCTAPLKSVIAGQRVYSWQTYTEGVSFKIFGVASGWMEKNVLDIDPISIELSNH